MYFAEHEWEEVTVSELNRGDIISTAELNDGKQSVEAGAVVIDSITWMKDSTVADIYAGPGGYRRVFEDIRAGDMVWRQVPGKPKVDLLTAPLGEVMVAVLEGADVRWALNVLIEEQHILARQVTVHREAVVSNETKWRDSVKRYDIINLADNAREIVAGKKDGE